MIKFSTISDFLKEYGIPSDKKEFVFSDLENEFFDLFVSNLDSLLHKNSSDIFVNSEGLYTLEALNSAYRLSIVKLKI